MGHLVRTLVLARELERRNARVVFLCSEGSLVQEEVRQAGFETLVVPLVWGQDNSGLKEVVSQRHLDIMLVDLLEPDLLGFRWLSDLPLTIAGIQSLDYIFRPRFEHVIFYPGLGIPENDFQEGPEGLQVPVFGGAGYLVMREEFHQEFPCVVRPEANRVLVCMGGADPGAFTVKVQKALELIARPLEIRVLVGRAQPDGEEVLRLAQASHHGVTVLRDVNPVSEQMRWADLAVINGGLVRYELAITRTPFIAISLHRVQFDITQTLTRYRTGINLGVGDQLTAIEIANSVDGLLHHREIREDMAHNMEHLLDSQGAARVVDRMLQCARERSARGREWKR